MSVPYDLFGIKRFPFPFDISPYADRKGAFWVVPKIIQVNLYSSRIGIRMCLPGMKKVIDERSHSRFADAVIGVNAARIGPFTFPSFVYLGID